MHPGLIGGLAATVAMGLGVGWMAGAPRSEAVAPQVSPATAAALAADTPQRRALREHMVAAVVAIQHNPCDDASLASLFDSLTEQAEAQKAAADYKPGTPLDPMHHPTRDPLLLAELVKAGGYKNGFEAGFAMLRIGGDVKKCSRDMPRPMTQAALIRYKHAVAR